MQLTRIEKAICEEYGTPETYGGKVHCDICPLNLDGVFPDEVPVCYATIDGRKAKGLRRYEWRTKNLWRD